MIYFKQTGESFSTLYEARDAVLREAKHTDLNERIEADLTLDAGTYRLDAPIIFSAEEEKAFSRVALSVSCEDGEAVLTSLLPLEAEGFVKNGSYYTYQFEKNADGTYPLFHDFYVNGKRIPIARSAFFTHAFAFNEDNKRVNSDNLEGIYISEEAAALLPEGDLGALEFTIYVEWECFVMHAVALDKTRTKTDENGNVHVLLKLNTKELYGYITGMTKCLRPKGREFFFGNHPAFLTEDTWCYDHHSGILYYAPKGDDLGDCAVPMLEKLLCFDRMNGVRLENLTFTGVTDRYTSENGYLSHQANVEKQLGAKAEESAVLVKNSRKISIENCRFTELGTNAILMMGKLAGVYIRNCRFEYVAMCAISIGDPVTPSYQNRDGSFDVRVENNYFYHIAYEFPTAPVIDIFRVDGVTVSRNTIEYCAYTGISLGWGWGLVDCALGEMVNIRDAEISYNRIVHFMQMLRDGGAIYAVGANCTKEYTKYFNFMHDNFAYRDEVKQTVRGFYLDGSATNWHVYDNVGSGMQRPAFAQFHVPTEFTWNVRIDDTYATEKIDAGNHAPARNSILGNVYLEPTIKELFAKYPKAKDIYERSGADVKGTVRLF